MKFSNPQSRSHQAHKWAIGLCAAAMIPLLAACPGPLDSKFTSGDCKDKRTRGELVTCVGGTVTGTGGMGGGGTGGSGVTNCDAVTRVFNNNMKYGCASSIACHGAGSPNVDLTKPPADALIGKASSTKDSLCLNMPLVDPADVTKGVLFERMIGTSCGPNMPPVIGPVAAEDVQCVRDWLKFMTTQASQSAFEDSDSNDDPALGANE